MAIAADRKLDKVYINKDFDTQIGSILDEQLKDYSSVYFDKVDHILTNICNVSEDELVDANGNQIPMRKKLQLIAEASVYLSPGEKGLIGELTEFAGADKKAVEIEFRNQIEKAFEYEETLILENGKILEEVNVKMIEDEEKVKALEIENEGLKAAIEARTEAIEKMKLAAEKLLESSSGNTTQAAEIAKQNNYNKMQVDIAKESALNVADINKESSNKKELEVLGNNITATKAMYDEKLKANNEAYGVMLAKQKEIQDKFKELEIDEKPRMVTGRSNNVTDPNAQAVQGAEQGSQQQAKQAQGQAVQAAPASSSSYVEMGVNGVPTREEMKNLSPDQRAKIMLQNLEDLAPRELKLFVEGYGYETIEVALNNMPSKFDRQRLASLLRMNNEIQERNDIESSHLNMPNLQGVLGSNADKIVKALNNNDLSSLKYNDFVVLSRLTDNYNKVAKSCTRDERKILNDVIMDKVSRNALLLKCDENAGKVSGIKQKFKSMFDEDTRKTELARQTFIKGMTRYNKDKADMWANEVKMRNTVFGNLGKLTNTIDVTPSSTLFRASVNKRSKTTAELAQEELSRM